MNLDKLYEIIRETTMQLRKGEVVERLMAGSVEVVEINAMPHVREAPAALEIVDLELLAVGVDKEAAAKRKDELVALLHDYPQPDRLAGGPSYIEVGAEIGDQGAAFQLFALGKVLGLWSVFTPATMGITGPEARELAWQGLVMISGFKARAD
jgi:hypothetical protein